MPPQRTTLRQDPDHVAEQTGVRANVVRVRSRFPTKLLHNPDHGTAGSQIWARVVRVVAGGDHSLRAAVKNLPEWFPKVVFGRYAPSDHSLRATIKHL